FAGAPDAFDEVGGEADVPVSPLGAAVGGLLGGGVLFRCLGDEQLGRLGGGALAGLGLGGHGSVPFGGQGGEQVVETVDDGDGGDVAELVEPFSVGCGFGNEGAAWNVVRVDGVSAGGGPLADRVGDAAVGGGAGGVSQVDEDVGVGQGPAGPQIFVDLVDELAGIADAVEGVVFGLGDQQDPVGGVEGVGGSQRQAAVAVSEDDVGVAADLLEGLVQDFAGCHSPERLQGGGEGAAARGHDVQSLASGVVDGIGQGHTGGVGVEVGEVVAFGVAVADHPQCHSPLCV